MPATRNLTCYRGDTFVYRLEFVDAAGAPVDVSARTFRGMVRRRWSDPSPEATFTVDTSQAASGVVRFTLAATLTEDLEPGRWTYDVEQTDSGDVLTVTRGRFDVEGDRTF